MSTAASVVSKTVITELVLAVDGNLTLDIGEREEATVTKMRITYRDAEVAAIAYDTIEHGEPSSAVVHPDFIDKPDAWPYWARALVNNHRPA
jgi:hypothetical protein